MADFKQAVEWIKEGKKVRRPIWDKDNYIELVGTTRYIQDKYRVVEVNLNMIEATDWEIYEEEDDWSLELEPYNFEEINKYVNGLNTPAKFEATGYRYDSIKKLKEKILQDKGIDFEKISPHQYVKALLGLEVDKEIKYSAEFNALFKVFVKYIEEDRKILDKRFGF